LASDASFLGIKGDRLLASALRSFVLGLNSDSGAIVLGPVNLGARDEGAKLGIDWGTRDGGALVRLKDWRILGCIRDDGALGVGDWGILEEGALVGPKDCDILEEGAIVLGIPDCDILEEGAIVLGIPDCGILEEGAIVLGITDCDILEEGAIVLGIPDCDIFDDPIGLGRKED